MAILDRRHELPALSSRLYIGNTGVGFNNFPLGQDGDRRWASCADGGRRALELLRATVDGGDPFAVVMLDQEMPDMDDIELARAIKNDPVIAGVRLIMPTS